MKKSKHFRLPLPLGNRTVKVDLDNTAVAMCEKAAPVVEIDMLTVDTKQPLTVRLDMVTWILAEGTENNGAKFRYLIGLPQKEGREKP